MQRVYDIRRLTADGIFDLEDSYARRHWVREPNPRPIGSVRLYLVGQMLDGQRRDFPCPLEMIVTRSPSGYLLFFGLTRHTQDQTSRRIAAGTYIVRVESDYYQTAQRTDINLPRHDAAYVFELVPGFAYPFPARVARATGPTLLRGSLRQHNGEGIADARIEAIDQDQDVTYRTDASGQWVLVFPYEQPDATITVRWTLPDTTTREVAVQVTHGHETRLLQAALRGWVLNATGLGIRGATVEVEGRSGQVFTRSDGEWFYYFDLDQSAAQVSVIARLADGRSQTKDDISVQPGATQPVPAFQFM